VGPGPRSRSCRYCNRSRWVVLKLWCGEWKSYVPPEYWEEGCDEWAEVECPF